MFIKNYGKENWIVCVWWKGMILNIFWLHCIKCADLSITIECWCFFHTFFDLSLFISFMLTPTDVAIYIYILFKKNDYSYHIIK